MILVVLTRPMSQMMSQPQEEEKVDISETPENTSPRPPPYIPNSHLVWDTNGIMTEDTFGSEPYRKEGDTFVSPVAKLPVTSHWPRRTFITTDTTL